YGDAFPAWSARTQVRVLLLDPEYPRRDQSYAQQRDKEERNQHGAIARDAREFIRQTANLAAGNNRFRIRLYRCLPSVNVFRIDDTLFWGPYLMGAQSRNMPTFQ